MDTSDYARLGVYSTSAAPGLIIAHGRHSHQHTHTHTHTQTQTQTHVCSISFLSHHIQYNIISFTNTRAYSMDRYMCVYCVFVTHTYLHLSVCFEMFVHACLSLSYVHSVSSLTAWLSLCICMYWHIVTYKVTVCLCTYSTV